MKIVHLIRKPCPGNVGTCLTEHGAGGLYIDGTRIGFNVMTESRMRQKEGGIYAYHNMQWKQKPNDNPREYVGRWPANAILQHLPGCKTVGLKKVKAKPKTASDGWEIVPAWECGKKCPLVPIDSRFFKQVQ